MTWTTEDIGDQSGRTAMVTGANTGLGYQTAEVLAGKGARVVLACRNEPKAKTAAESIRRDHPAADVEVLALDLGDLSAVRDAAADAHERFERIDLLINNAGVMFPPLQRTPDGFEMQFGTNHLGHFAFSGLMFDLVSAAPASRIVTVSSTGHRMGTMRWDDLQWEKRYNRVRAYGQSKLANLLFTYELARRLGTSGSDAIAVASHPGMSDTELTRHAPGYNLAPVRAVVDVVAGLVAQPADKGALPSLRAATDPTTESGDYYGPDGVAEIRGNPEKVESNAASRNVDDARRLWSVSEELTGVSWL